MEYNDSTLALGYQKYLRFLDMSAEAAPGSEFAKIAEHLYSTMIVEEGWTPIPHVFTGTVKRIGKGGFGSVFLVNRTIVVKCVMIGTEEEGLRFLNEVEAWENLRDIPELANNIPEYMGSTTYNYRPWPPHVIGGFDLHISTMAGFIFQRFQPVEELTDCFNITSIVDVNRSRILFDNIIRAFDVLHRNNFVHRDIKPPNILIRTTPGPLYNEPIIIDVGMICKMPCQVSSLAGTMHFLPRNFFPLTNRQFRLTPIPPLPVVKAPTRSIADRLSYFVARRLLGRESTRPIKPTRAMVEVRDLAEELMPRYTAATDKYALGLTLERVVKYTDFHGNTAIKEEMLGTIAKLKKAVISQLAASAASVLSDKRARNARAQQEQAAAAAAPPRASLKGVFNRGGNAVVANSQASKAPPGGTRRYRHRRHKRRTHRYRKS